jgi:hypothetical protein
LFICCTGGLSPKMGGFIISRYDLNEGLISGTPFAIGGDFALIDLRWSS